MARGSLRIDVDTEGFTDTQANLSAMIVRSKAMQPVFLKARRTLEQANVKNFTTGGLPVGGWKPREKDERYQWPILRKTGKLFNSLANMRGPGSVVGPTFANFGTDVEYAKFHQYGTEHMAKRTILFNPRTFGEEVARDAGKWIVNGRV